MWCGCSRGLQAPEGIWMRLPSTSFPTRWSLACGRSGFLISCWPNPWAWKNCRMVQSHVPKAKDRDWDIQGLKKSAGNLLISLPYSSASRLSPCSYSKAEEVKWDSWLQVTLEVLALITVLVCIEHLVQRSGSFLELSWEGVDIWVESQSENWATALDATESLPILHSLQ